MTIVPHSLLLINLLMTVISTLIHTYIHTYMQCYETYNNLFSKYSSFDFFNICCMRELRKYKFRYGFNFCYLYFFILVFI